MVKGKAGKQPDLPGMEDRKIQEIHEKSILYDAVKTRRMELTKRESELKKEVRGLMEKYQLQERGYNVGGVKVTYTPPDGEADISVKVTLMKEDTQPILAAAGLGAEEPFLDVTVSPEAQAAVEAGAVPPEASAAGPVSPQDGADFPLENQPAGAGDRKESSRQTKTKRNPKMHMVH